MSQTILLGSSEGRLCGVLAAALPAGRLRGEELLASWQVHLSTFQSVAIIFDKLDLLEPNPSGLIWIDPILKYNVAEIEDLLAIAVPNGDERVGELLLAFVGAACRYYGVSDEHEAFSVDPPLLPAFEELARHGYVQKTEEKFVWTDKIGPIMRAEDLWNEELISYKTLERKAVHSEAQVAWSTMPEAIKREQLSQRPKDLRPLYDVLARHWRDGRWQDPIDKVSVKDHRHLIAVARRIAELAGHVCTK